MSKKRFGNQLINTRSLPSLVKPISYNHDFYDFIETVNL